MVKMIMALPRHIDGEKFVELTMDVIKGRYGKDGYYNGVMPYASAVVYLSHVSNVFKKGFSGKNGLNYYEINAEELDPVIIATLEELGELSGMDYSFVTENRFIKQDWWRPEDKNFQLWGGTYCDGESVDRAREDYDYSLRILNGEFKPEEKFA